MANVIAITGIAGRFPGEPSIEALWRNLSEGLGSASREGEDGPWVSRTRRFVEGATEALREAGGATPLDTDRTGLFTRGEDSDPLAADVARELDLRGPVVTVPGAALAAVDRACRSLRSGECDLAVVGGVSPDGAATAVVVLRRLPDALAQGDRILAVLRGSAVAAEGTESAAGRAAALGEIPAETLGYVDADSAAGAGDDAAAGLAGLLRATLVVERGFPRSGDTAGPAGPRRALVSSPGPLWVHVVLEQAPPPVPCSSLDPALAAGGPPRQRPALANAFAPPANRLEAAIASLWQEQLGIDRVGVDDNFFELGGTSILGVRILTELKGWLHQEIPTVSLYEGPTVSALAKILVHSGPPKGYDLMRERGERRRRKLQRSAGAGQGA
jgi:acyl carrier protein